MVAYLKLGLAALAPVAVAAILYILDNKTAFGRIPHLVKQIIIGVLFGGLAVLGTEYGIPMNGAQVNCRDGAVLTAGLFFGGPAGIIAGVIGGVERWFAVAWGVGSYTRIACTVSTVAAGFYAALLRKHLFDEKKPGVFLSLAVGIVMEVFHLMMVFLTHMREPEEAMNVIKACSAPLLIANGAAVMLAALVLALLSRERLGFGKNASVRISQTVQKGLLISVTAAFLVTSGFVYLLQTRIADNQTLTLLNLAVDEVSKDISDSSDSNLLSLVYEVAEALSGGKNIYDVASGYDVAEVNLVNAAGIITESSNPDNMGFDMSSGSQSAEFLCLLDDEDSFVQGYGPISRDAEVYRKYAGIRYGDGFVQVGYDAALFQSDIAGEIVNISQNRHVGKTGFVLIADENFDLVSAPEQYRSVNFREAASEAGGIRQGTTTKLVLGGVPCFCRYVTTEGYYIVSALPVSEAYWERNVAIYVNTFLEILVFAVMFAVIYLLIKNVVVSKLQKVNQSLQKITGGDLNEVVNVRSNEEFADLSDDINRTVDTLKKYIAEESKRIDKELETAKTIQNSALPNVSSAFPNRKEFEIYAIMDPAKEVGGDFYDFYLSDADTLQFLVADVSGKGIPAAMFMMRAKAQLKSLTESGAKVGEVFTQGNNALCEGNEASMFVTAWQGGLDLATGALEFANAGHNPPLIRRGDGKFEYLRSRAGFVLAGLEGMSYGTQELALEPGDVVFLYTDGVTEATNLQNELFGEDRLLDTLNSVEFGGMKELCEGVQKAVEEFTGEAAQFDDITMVALRFDGKPEIPHIHFDAATVEDIPKVNDFVEAQLEKLDCPPSVRIQLDIVVDEICSNIVKYAYPADCPGEMDVKFIYRESDSTVFLRFEDRGMPYNPLTKEDPDVTLDAEQRKIGGLGIFMVRKTTDSMKYKYEDEKNILTVGKHLRPQNKAE